MRGWGDRLSEEGYLRRKEDIEAFNNVKREDFLDLRMRISASLDEPLPIAHGQTQSAPHMNAIFVDNTRPGKKDSVLEIGTGSGYLTAILSLLSGKVVSVEYFCDLSKTARKRIASYSRGNVYLICGDINRICFRSKFDAIISTSSFRREPTHLLPFLKEEGRMIFPLGSYPPQKLIKIEKGERKDLGYVSFVTIIE